MRWISFTNWLVPLLTLTCSLAGCQKSDHPVLAKVRGEVMYQGEPLEQGLIVFHPATGRSAEGKISFGQITDVTTFEPNDGAPVGELKVTIVSLEEPGEDVMAPRKSLIPKKYGSLQSTELTAELQPGIENEVLFELEGPPEDQ